MARPLIEARTMLYGWLLLEFIARETFAAHARRMMAATGTEKNPAGVQTDTNDVIPGDASSRGLTDGGVTYNALKEIHAAWLLTPRDDLGSACPRDVAIDRRDHLAWDLQNQADRWSNVRAISRRNTPRTGDCVLCRLAIHSVIGPS